MDIQQLRHLFNEETENNRPGLKNAIKKAWEQSGVAADDALFTEAYVYGFNELERSIKLLPKESIGDPLEVMIELELQFLAQSGNFAPAQIEDKTREIVAAIRL